MKKALLILLVLVVAFSFLACKKKEAAAPAGPKYKIGICFDTGGRGDQSFNDSSYAGLVRLAQEFKGYIKDDPDNVNFGTEIEMNLQTGEFAIKRVPMQDITLSPGPDGLRMWTKKALERNGFRVVENKERKR